MFVLLAWLHFSFFVLSLEETQMDFMDLGRLPLSLIAPAFPWTPPGAATASVGIATLGASLLLQQFHVLLTLAAPAPCSVQGFIYC